MNEKDEEAVTERDPVIEALAILISDGRVTVRINEDGERVFRLAETRE